MLYPLGLDKNTMPIVQLSRGYQQNRKCPRWFKSCKYGCFSSRTGINVDTEYLKVIVPNLDKVVDLGLTQAEDLVDGTNNLDGFVALSSALKTAAVNLSKMAMISDYWHQVLGQEYLRSIYQKDRQVHP